MVRLIRWCALAVFLEPTWHARAALNTVRDLADHYSEIFKSGNRNAASHLWTKFILDRANEMDAKTLQRMFRGFCPVSGSPLPDDPHTHYKVTLAAVGGGTVTGISMHCCWPCICDLRDAVRVDTKTIATTDGEQQYHVLVIGNPCLHPEKLNQYFVDPFAQRNTNLKEEAPEIQCDSDGSLVGAYLSDRGHPILGMFFTDADTNSKPFTDASQYNAQCASREDNGYNSGMGQVFHQVAMISPIAADPLTEYEAETPKLFSQVSLGPWTTGASVVLLGVGCFAVARAAFPRSGGSADVSDIESAAAGPKE